MSALKTKLAEKVEIINAEAMPLDSSNKDKTIKDTLEQESNIIMLRNADFRSTSSFVPSFAITLNESKERLLMLQKFIKEVMIPGVDYGLIPKCEKPTLFKSGAEKLTDIFGFSKQFEIINRLEDWNKGLFHYEIKAILTNKKTGLIESEGLGCCNNRERKFKTQDAYSVINTILKMSKKRALIDAVLSATRSSGIFTQDIEDIDNNYELNTGNLSTQSTASYNNFNHNIQKTTYHKHQINKSQQTKLISIINQRRIPIEDIKAIMKEKYNVNESKNLSYEQADDFIGFLKLYNAI